MADRITSYNVCYTKLLRSNNKAYGYSTYEIGSYIKKSKTLKSINLYGNNLKNKDVMHLGACVAQSESVEYRITSYNVCYTKLLRGRLYSCGGR